MVVDIYESETKGLKFLIVPGGTNLGTFAWPANLDSDLLKVRPFKIGHTIQPNMIGVSYQAVIDQIHSNGFAVAQSKVTTTVQAVKKP